ncbi:hypothetical protein SAY86_017349 [Trapa natans]|uniref:Helicase C-terminal domain-containing protein n=1 Tax=Trapa natans TaxID=22666 RepID=A0AAN7M651_TRANT|nr:hypothetical protein SAY86_017349 [Trapa natans]
MQLPLINYPDIASNGLDYSDIQHLINYDMPAEIENQVHRIGRTGRCGKTGIATTINKNQSETTLLHLKHLLQEANQNANRSSMKAYEYKHFRMTITGN